MVALKACPVAWASVSVSEALSKMQSQSTNDDPAMLAHVLGKHGVLTCDQLWPLSNNTLRTMGQTEGDGWQLTFDQVSLAMKLKDYIAENLPPP